MVGTFTSVKKRCGINQVASGPPFSLPYTSLPPVIIVAGLSERALCGVRTPYCYYYYY